LTGTDRQQAILRQRFGKGIGLILQGSGRSPDDTRTMS
jgi:hypothetical protein